MEVAKTCAREMRDEKDGVMSDKDIRNVPVEVEGIVSSAHGRLGVIAVRS